MRLRDAFRDATSARRVADQIAREASRPLALMEVCGGQTHAIVAHGIDALLPPDIELLHGPGCPVCVTPLQTVDRAHAIASLPGVVFCSFGDMLRVPGSHGDLLGLKARGHDVRVVYSPLDALAIAEASPGARVVFFAVGFETTAPANALAVSLARRRGIANFSLLVSHVLVPPALTFILGSPDNRVRAFLGPGHVCTVAGTREYDAVAQRWGVPIVVAGFEPLDLLDGVLRAVRQVERGEARTEIQYARVVRDAGNESAQRIVDEVFEPCDREWRGLGTIPASGLRLRQAFRAFDAEERFAVHEAPAVESTTCISGRILRGLAKPTDCPAFGRACTPDRPLGATMVSSEGTCAAYFRHGRHLPSIAGDGSR